MNGELENELADLCHRFFDPPYIDKSPEKIMSFFERLIQENQKVTITNEIRYFIPILATYGNGKFASMLDPCIEDLSPMHYVPDLQLSSNFNYDSQEQQSDIDQNTLHKPKEPSESKRSSYSRNYSSRSQKSTNDNNQTFRVIHTSRSFQRRPRAPVSISELSPGLQLTLPRTARTSHSARTMSVGRARTSRAVDRFSFRQQLPPLKENQDNIMPALYIRDNPNFFTGKKMKPKKREISIMPPQYPQHLIGNNFEILCSSGVINVKENKGTVTSLPQFVLDNSNDFMVHQIFKNSKAGKYFFIWKELFREKRFRRIITNFDKIDIISRPLFNEFIEKIRDRILTNTESLNIFDQYFDDGVNDVKFEEFQQVSNKSILEMEEVIISICTNTEKELSDFFRQVRATNLQMQLDFEELHSLNLLPPSLEEYSGDLKWRSPSLTREKERNKLLKRERRIAFDRQNYLGKFFIRARGVYNGTLLKQCYRCLLSFLSRFSKNFTDIHIELVYPEESHKSLSQSQKINPDQSKKKHKNKTKIKNRRLNKIYGLFDLNEGIIIEPTHEVFQKWIKDTVADIKHAFLLQNKQLSSEIISEVDPEFSCQFDNPLLTIERYPLWQEILEDVLDEVECSYVFFETKILPNKNFMKELKSQVEYCNKFNDIRNVDQLEMIIEGLLKADDTLIRWPRNIFHKVEKNKDEENESKNGSESNDEIVDFILEMRLAIEEALKYLRAALEDLIKRAVNEINNKIFSEIQEKWSVIHKEERINKEDTRFIESRLLLYAKISKILVDANSDVLGDVKGSIEVLTSVYRALNNKSNYTHESMLELFNEAAETVGLTGVTFDPDDMEYGEEEEEEEANEIEAMLAKMNNTKPKKKKKKKKTKNANKIDFNDENTQTMTEEEEELERRKMKEEEERKKRLEEEQKQKMEEEQNKDENQK